MAAGSSRGQTSTANWATFHRDHYGSNADRQAASSLPSRPRRASKPLRFFFVCFFFLKPLGNFSASERANVPATFRERGMRPIINQDTQDRPAAFMPVEQAGEELGPLERSADVRVAARLKTSRLKCMCATDVRGDSQTSCVFLLRALQSLKRDSSQPGHQPWAVFLWFVLE